MVTSVVKVVDKNLIYGVETVFDFGQSMNKRNNDDIASLAT